MDKALTKGEIHMMDSILFRAEGGDIAGFLNLASENGLTIQKFCKAEGICFGYLPPGEYRTAARLARSVGIRLQILEKNGVSFALRRYRRRLGLFVWPVICGAALVFSQNFLWAVDVSGCETFSEEVIRAEAAELGLRTGIYLPGTDLAAIASELRREFPGIAFAALNRVGSRVEIALNEVTPAPVILPEDPCNIVAAHTGQVVSVTVTAGQTDIVPGQTVAEGQLLISGIGETPDGKQIYSHASGVVMAEAVIEKEFSLPLRQTEKVFTGEEKARRYLDLFGKKLPLFLPDELREKLGQEIRPYESSCTLAPLTLFGIGLPLGIETETRRAYTEQEKVFTESEALALLQEASADWEQNEAAGEILSKEESASVSGGIMTLKTIYTCLADIGSEQPVEVIP